MAHDPATTLGQKIIRGLEEAVEFAKGDRDMRLHHVPITVDKRNAADDLIVRHALTIMRLQGLLREARDSRAADVVPNNWASRVDEALNQ